MKEQVTPCQSDQSAPLDYFIDNCKQYHFTMFTTDYNILSNPIKRLINRPCIEFFKHYDCFNTRNVKKNLF